MTWNATARIMRPDNQHKTKRMLTFEAPDRESAEAMLPDLVKQGGYSGYELLKVVSLEEV